MENTELFTLLEQYLDYGIMGILSIMSVVSLWLFVERMMYYKAVKIEEFKHKDEFELELGSNLGTISAIGANAPYVGLLGTVLGIMLTFYTLGDVGAVDAKKIMTGLALALKATAFGLIVAIPAIAFYTILLRKMERLMVAWDINNKENQGIKDN
jgi:biopolymer transport protein ExbB